MTNLPAIIRPGLPEAAPVGIHLDVPAERYHADTFGGTPTLSSSIAKLLVTKTPAHARLAHPRLGEPEEEADDESKFDLGSAAHEMILGRGAGISVAPFDSWRTKDAKEFRALARSRGRTPMLQDQFDRASKVALAARSHPHAAYQAGHAEVVLVWRDIGGPLCRAMLDHWDGATTITDVKTTDVPLSDLSLGRLIANLEYHLSAAFYMRGLVALRPDLAGRLRFRWHFVETVAPFGTRMVEADPEMLTFGDRRAALAVACWQRCLTTKRWNGWSPQIERIALPNWSATQQLDLEMSHPDADTAVFSNSMPPYVPAKLTEPV